MKSYALSTIAITACALYAYLERTQVHALQEELDRQTQLRQQERAGRTKAEKEARQAIHRHQESHGHQLEEVATVRSCFADRRGTPRQGALVPSAKARLEFAKRIPPPALEGLEEYSHLWVIFVFHENTNIAKNGSTFPAKIKPPRLGGGKVGLYSTRTPHRPNPIGLTVVKIDRIHGRCIDISGHDLVDGTPVLDVKPYVPADCIQAHRGPAWVEAPTDIFQRSVEFTQDANNAIKDLIDQQKLDFYSDSQDVVEAIKQILVLDIRSTHQKRGQAASDQTFHCRFDKLQIEFQTHETIIQVTKISAADM